MRGKACHWYITATKRRTIFKPTNKHKGSKTQWTWIFIMFLAFDMMISNTVNHWNNGTQSLILYHDYVVSLTLLQFYYAILKVCSNFVNIFQCNNLSLKNAWNLTTYYCTTPFSTKNHQWIFHENPPVKYIYGNKWNPFGVI